MGSTSTEAKVTEMEKYMREMQRQINELTLQRDQLQMKVQSLKKNTGRVDSETGDSRDKTKVDPWSDWAGQTWTSRSSKEAWHAEQSEEHWQHKENNDTQRSNWWKEERRKRTLTIGGFLRDSRRDDNVTAAKEIFKDVWGVEDNGIYSLFKRTRVAFVRFQTESDKWSFLKSLKGQERPNCYARPLWTTSEKRPEERRRGKAISKAAKIFADKMGMPDNSDRIETDYKAGTVWVDERRVSSWSRWGKQMTFDGAQIAKLKIEWTSEAAEEAWDLAMSRITRNRDSRHPEGRPDLWVRYRTRPVPVRGHRFDKDGEKAADSDSEECAVYYCI